LSRDSAFCQNPCWGLKKLPRGGASPQDMLRQIIKTRVVEIEIRNGMILI
jgi:hypothetical protein